MHPGFGDCHELAVNCLHFTVNCLQISISIKSHPTFDSTAQRTGTNKALKEQIF